MPSAIEPSRFARAVARSPASSSRHDSSMYVENVVRADEPDEHGSADLGGQDGTVGAQREQQAQEEGTRDVDDERAPRERAPVRSATAPSTR